MPTAAQAPALSLDDVLNPSAIAGIAPTHPRWAPDSRHLAFIWSESPEKPRALWLTTLDGQRRKLEQSDGLTAFAWLPTSQALVAIQNEQIWRFDLNGARSPLTPKGRAPDKLDVCIDRVVFLSAGDLWQVPVVGGTAMRLTQF
ncbi:MAG: hypothetical protein AAFN74_15660, partial [Myxococcota bacterium]